jgi:hypothetical protein
MSDMEKAVAGGAEHIAAQQKQYADEQAAENARAEAAGNDYPTTINTGSYEDVGTATIYQTVVYGYDTIEEANAAQAEAKAQGLWAGTVEPYGTGGGAVRLQVPGTPTKPASDNSQ